MVRITSYNCPGMKMARNVLTEEEGFDLPFLDLPKVESILNLLLAGERAVGRVGTTAN